MSSMLPVDQQMRLLERGVEEILPKDELETKLAKAIETQTPLRIKEGFDASAPDLHLGHCVQLRKLRQFQDLGHQVLFLIGDFTAMIGDPSGKSATRPMLTREQVLENAESYRKQVFKVLDPDKIEVLFNSEWCLPMTSVDVLQLSSQYTVARMIERDDFQKRYRGGQPISLQEFLYPLFQGYDSVQMKADVELGGTDQKFNLLVGRELQRVAGQRPQTVMTLPLLPGTDGVEKMSKSLGNAIGITEPPSEMFGKVMSIPDDAMARWFELVSDLDTAAYDQVIQDIEAQQTNPSVHKRRLAANVVDQFHGPGEGAKAEVAFDKIFVKGGEPDEVECQVLPVAEEPVWIVGLLADLKLAPSRGEARRLIQQGGVAVEGERVTDVSATIAGVDGSRYRLKVGKRRFLDIEFRA